MQIVGFPTRRLICLLKTVFTRPLRPLTYFYTFLQVFFLCAKKTKVQLSCIVTTAYQDLCFCNKVTWIAQSLFFLIQNFKLSSMALQACWCRVRSYLSRHKGQPTICIGENKGADQLRSYCKADQHLVFATCIVQFLYFLNTKFPASNHLLRLYSLVCVTWPEPKLLIFSRPGSSPIYLLMDILRFLSARLSTLASSADAPYFNNSSLMSPSDISNRWYRSMSCSFSNKFYNNKGATS